MQRHVSQNEMYVSKNSWGFKFSLTQISESEAT